MPQTIPPDVGSGPGGPVSGGGDYPMTTGNQSLQGESNIGDSSWPLFSIYSDAAKNEDSEMVVLWQKDAEGIVIFTGLFSAALAAFLAVTVQDLKPNIQETSAFHLGNIYQVLADPNATRSSTPSSITEPSSFSPSRHAVWVNTLWFLSLVMSLSCALWATSLQQWTRRYLRRVQPAQCNPEKRARMRAFFAEGADNVHIPWAVEGLPALLHLSLFLFFGGLAIFLFNVDREVFRYVVWWIGLFSLVYGMITLLPLIRHDSIYYSPLSTPAWMLYTGLAFVTFKILAFVTYRPRRAGHSTWEYCRDLGNHYHRQMSGGVEKAAEEAVSERLPKIDSRILEWTITTLGDDDSLENFFKAIPGFLNSNLVKDLDSLKELYGKLSDALDGFWDRTLSSNSASDSVKARRLDISLEAMDRIRDSDVSPILHNILFKRWDKVPQTLEVGQTVARWTSSNNVSAYYAQSIVSRILVSLQKYDYKWVSLAVHTFGLPELDLGANIADGRNSVLLAVLIYFTRQSLSSDYPALMVFEGLSKLDIHKTLPRLQHDFCTLWNEIVQEARKHRPSNTPVYILREIRHLYITLHHGTAAPTVFSASTNYFDPILSKPSSYQFCKIADHRPQHSFSPLPTDGGNTASRPAEQVNSAKEPLSSSNPTTTGDIGATSHGPVHSSSRQIGSPPTAAVAAAPQDITSTATLSHPLGGSEQQGSDIVAPSSEPGTSQILSTASTHAPTPTLAPIPTYLPSTSSKSCNAGLASVSNSSHFPPSSIGSYISVSRPTGSATLPGLRARGLVNTGNICFVNAVLQLFVNLPPFRNLFRELGDLKGQRGTGVSDTGSGATPLVDATVRFFEEFMVEESPATQQQSQPTTDGTSRADEEKKEHNVDDSFEPRYMYDAMKEKRQLKPLLDGQQQDAEEFLRLYLDALDEELSALSDRQSATIASAVLEVEEGEVSQSGQTEVESQGSVANFVDTLITRLFGGKFRSLVRTSNKPDVVTTEDWRSLHLDVLPDSVLTVQDAILRVSQSQFTQDGLSGSSDSDASQQMLIEALPPVLVLHLKRFRYDEAAGGVVKIGKHVQFFPDLEIPFDVMAPAARQPANPAHYALCGVLYHHGESAGSGHYTVDVLHPPNGDGDAGKVWLHIDDEAVIPVRHEDVFGEHADERCAYLLFYCRTSPKDTS